MAGIYPCNGIDLVSYLTGEEIGATQGLVNDMWGWTDPVTGTEWALVGHTLGTAFVSLEDPVDPLYAGMLPLTDGASPSAWRDIKVYQDHAFIVSDAAGQHGMQVFDLTRLRDFSGTLRLSRRPRSTTQSIAPTTSSSTRKPASPIPSAAAGGGNHAAAGST